MSSRINYFAPFAAAAVTLLSSCAMRSLEHSVPALIAPRTVSLDGGLVTYEGRPPKGWIDYAKSPDRDVVQLWTRRSWYADTLALHPFFLAYDKKGDTWMQSEIWAGSEFGYYHSHNNGRRHYSDGRDEAEIRITHTQVGAVRQYSPVTYVDESPSEFLMHEWRGEAATRLLAVLQRPEAYPEHYHYWIWPGPNSNSYARWVLDEAGVSLDLHPKMVGKDWHPGPLGFGVGLTPSRTGLHVDVLTLGAAVGLLDGIELHMLGMTWGIDLWPPAIKTPLGRLGMEE